jgi:hypothetical protein
MATSRRRSSLRQNTAKKLVFEPLGGDVGDVAGLRGAWWVSKPGCSYSRHSFKSRTSVYLTHFESHWERGIFFKKPRSNFRVTYQGEYQFGVGEHEQDKDFSSKTRALAFIRTLWE